MVNHENKMRFQYLLLVCVFLNFSFAQVRKMKPLSELINNAEPGWAKVQDLIKSGTNYVEVLPKDSIRADSALYQTQVTTRSPMGAIIYETGGILVDHGWIRILGSGCTRMDRSIMEWNKGKSFNNTGDQMSFLLIADDVLGGFFAINAGGLDSAEMGKVFYFSPDNLKWEATHKTYSEFLCFCFSGDLNLYYEGYRWTDWKSEIKNLDGNKGMHIFPYLWSKEGQADINKNSRKPVPIQELWDLYFE
jgi:hypothetical protein